MPINIPVRQNQKLDVLLQRAEKDPELNQLWRSANVNAVNRMAMSDHGYVHVKIVANLAVKLLRLLLEAGIEPSMVKDHGMTPDESEVVVVLGALLHDVGMAVHRDRHHVYSLFIANRLLPKLLDGLYEGEARQIVTAEVLHAIVSHEPSERCLTIEAGIVKVANALDIAQGRSRVPFEAGTVNIHSVSAMSIDSVTLHKGEEKPVAIEIAMSNSAGIYLLDELLKHNLKTSGLEKHLEVEAKIEGETEKKLLRLYNL